MVFVQARADRAATPTKAEQQARMSIADPRKSGRIVNLVTPLSLGGGSALASGAGRIFSAAKNAIGRATRYNPFAGATTLKAGLGSFARGVAGKTLGFLTFTEAFRASQALATGKPYNPVAGLGKRIKLGAIAGINPVAGYTGFGFGTTQNLFSKAGNKKLFSQQSAIQPAIPFVNYSPALSLPAGAGGTPVEFPSSLQIPAPTIIMPAASSSSFAPSLSVGGGGGFDPTILLALFAAAGVGGYALGRRRRKRKKYKKRKRQ